MKTLKIPARLGLCMTFFVIPLALLLYFYTGEISRQIDFAQQEKKGTMYLRPLVQILANVNDHQLLVLRANLGDGSAHSEFAPLNDKMQRDLASLEMAQAKVGAALQFTGEGLKNRGRDHLTVENLRNKWQAAEASLNEKTEAIISIHQSLADDIRAMITHAGDTSNLILDPDLDSYYVMDAVVVAAPQGIGRFGTMAGNVAQMLEHEELDQAQRGKLAAYVAMISESDTGRIKADMDTAYNEDKNFYGQSPTLKASLEPKMADYQQASDALIAMLSSMITGDIPSQQQFLKQVDMTSRAAEDYWFAAADEMDVLLSKRIENFTMHRDETLLQALGAIALAFLFFLYVVRGITQPLNELQQAMIQIADGHLSHKVPCLALKDELGDMARTLEIFKETAIETQKLEAEKRKEQQRAVERQQQMDLQIAVFETKINDLLRDVSRAAESMQMASTSLVAAADETTTRMKATFGAAAEASSTVEAVAAASEELSAAINEISRQVTRSTDVTRSAVNQTNSADSTVSQLAGSAQRIGEVISLINSIAEQINLLALNATIESARAGEAGKGFAVVASEVKTLATQTSKATEAIASQITEVQGVTSSVVQALAQIQRIISEVSGIAATIASAVEEQGAATREIAVNIQRTSDRMHQVSDNMQEVNNVATATNDNAHSVLQSVKDFSEQSGKLQAEVKTFLANIAAS